MDDKQDEVKFLTQQLSRVFMARGNIANVLSSINILNEDFKHPEVSLTDEERSELFDIAKQEGRLLMEILNNTFQDTQNYISQRDDNTK